MAKTFTNEPLGKNFRYTCKTGGGNYVMGKSWIDTTASRDMMSYDFTQSCVEGVAAMNETHTMWASMQIR